MRFGCIHGQVENGGIIQRWQEAGILTIKAINEAYYVSHVFLKTALGRHRPNHPLEGGELEEPFTRDPWDFFNWHPVYWDGNSDGTAFPSYHFTMYFAIARVMQRQFDNYWIPYTLSMSPLVYELDGHNHWVSDMVAGAVIGTFIGNVVYEDYHQPADRDSPDSSAMGSLLDPSRWSFGMTPFYGGWMPYVRVGF